MTKKTKSKEQRAGSKGRSEAYLNFALCSLLFALYSSPLWAQSPSSGGGHYVVEQRYVQKLGWIGDNYTLKYEVIIEQYEGGGAPGGAPGGALSGALSGYKIYLKEFTEEPGFQVSLLPGKYRYRVIPYDYLEQPGEASDWVEINIDPAPIVSADETEKLLNLYVSAAWTPLIHLYGRIHETFGNGFYTAGASVRFGALYNKPRWLKPGIEFLTSWYTLNNFRSDDIKAMKTAVTGLNIVMQNKFSSPNIALTLRAGFALAYQVYEKTEYDEKTEEYSSFTMGGLLPQINAEASFLLFTNKKMYLEAGLGFINLIDIDDNSGCLYPWIGAGWRF